MATSAVINRRQAVRGGAAVVLAAASLTAVAWQAPAAHAATTGTISTWGDNALGELGIGSKVSRTTPGPGPSYSDITAISGGRDNALALRSNGSVLAWGNNNYGQDGDGTKTLRTSPVTVTALPPVSQIFNGHYHSMAMTAAGALYAWGFNATGQLGLGDKTLRTAPVQVPVGAPLASVDGGADFTIALGTDGTVWTWGDNAYGEVGDGTTTTRTSPVHVPGLSNIVTVAAARDSAFAVTSTGALYAWGRNDHGELGLGNTVNRTTPTLVTGISQVKAISAGAFHAVAVLSDGSVRAWGDNAYGNIGDGTTTKRLVPTVVSGLTNATYVECGRDYSFVVTSDGLLHGWGRNDAGQIGDGSITNKLVPVTVPGISGVTEVGAGRAYTAAFVAGTPDTQPPTVPGTPTATSPSAGTVSLSWPASTDDRATTLAYSVFRDGGNTPVGTVNSASTGAVSFTDSGLAGGSTHTYQVSASDGTNASALSPVSNQVTVLTGTPAVFSADFSNGLTGWSTSNVSLDSTRFPADGTAPSLRGATTATPQWATHPLGGSYPSLCVQSEVNLTSLSTAAILLRFKSASAAVARLYLTSTRMLAMRADGGAGKAFTSAIPMPVGGWHTLKLCSGVGTTAALSISLDGTQVLSGTASNGTAPITGLQVGDTNAVTETVNYDNVLVTTN